MSRDRTVPFSFLDLALLKEGEDHSDAYKRCLEVAKQCEELGFCRFWLAEHHNMAAVGSAAPTILMGYIARETNRIRVGSGGVMLPNHSPMVVAEQIGTLERLFPGRIDLGLGRAPGTDQQTARVIRRGRIESVQEFPEDLDELQGYFNEDSNGQRVRAFPAEGLDVPIFLLGSSMSSAQLAAEKGLPYVFASHFAPNYFQPAIHYYKNNFKPSNAWPKPYAIACVNVIAAFSKEKADFLASSFYQMALGIIRSKSYPLRAPTAHMDQIWSVQEAYAIKQMMTYSYFGTVDIIRRGLEDLLVKAGLDEIMVSTAIHNDEDRMQSLSLTAEAISSITAPSVNSFH
jgi:luciferase family oxidoreductase group 1